LTAAELDAVYSELEKAPGASKAKWGRPAESGGSEHAARARDQRRKLRSSAFGGLFGGLDDAMLERGFRAFRENAWVRAERRLAARMRREQRAAEQGSRISLGGVDDTITVVRTLHVEEHPELSGRLGMINSYSVRDGMYDVSFTTGERLRIRPAACDLVRGGDAVHVMRSTVEFARMMQTKLEGGESYIDLELGGSTGRAALLTDVRHWLALWPLPKDQEVTSSTEMLLDQERCFPGRDYRRKPPTFHALTVGADQRGAVNRGHLSHHHPSHHVQPRAPTAYGHFARHDTLHRPPPPPQPVDLPKRQSAVVQPGPPKLVDLSTLLHGTQPLKFMNDRGSSYDPLAFDDALCA
jgi:hypothetical protein